MTIVATESAVSRTIKSAKIAKSGGVEVEFSQTIMLLQDGKEIEIAANIPSYQGRNMPHPDLLQAFEMMRVHLAFLGDEWEAHNKTMHELDEDDVTLQKFKVTKFSIGGSDEHEGVTLVGTKRISSGRVKNITTPFQKYEDANEPYEYAMELSALIAHACNEVELYLDGKIAPDAQQTIDFDQESHSEDLE